MIGLSIAWIISGINKINDSYISEKVRSEEIREYIEDINKIYFKFFFYS